MNTNFPVGELVSMRSVSDSNSTPRERPQGNLGAKRLHGFGKLAEGTRLADRTGARPLPPPTGEHWVTGAALLRVCLLCQLAVSYGHRRVFLGYLVILCRQCIAVRINA